MPNSNRIYTEDFKLEAVKLASKSASVLKAANTLANKCSVGYSQLPQVIEKLHLNGVIDYSWIEPDVI